MNWVLRCSLNSRARSSYIGYEAGRRFDCIDIAIDAKLRPENPDKLVGHSIQIFAVFAPEEVIDGEDERGFFDAFGEIEIDLNVFAERY